MVSRGPDAHHTADLFLCFSIYKKQVFSTKLNLVMIKLVAGVGQTSMLTFQIYIHLNVYETRECQILYSPALATCVTSHVLLAGVSGGFPGVLPFRPTYRLARLDISEIILKGALN